MPTDTARSHHRFHWRIIDARQTTRQAASSGFSRQAREYTADYARLLIYRRSIFYEPFLGWIVLVIRTEVEVPSAAVHRNGITEETGTMMSLWSSLIYERTCKGRFADQPVNGCPAHPLRL